MQIRVLGGVDVRIENRAVAVDRPQQRLLLAVLAMEAGRPVPIEALVGRVWDQAPDQPRRSIYVLISRLRTVLRRASRTGEVHVVRRGGGYTLDIDEDRVDLLRFRRLVNDSGQSGTDGRRRLVLLREAVALWQGEPLADLAGQWVEQTRCALREQYLHVVAAWARAELLDGEPTAVLEVLTKLVTDHPLTESLAELLMLALGLAGRPADALAVFASVRQRLVRELGLEPSVRLQAVHQQILRGQVASIALGTALVERRSG